MVERAALCALGALALGMSCVQAPAGERWEEAASSAVAILPQPAESKGVLGGSLYCTEQKWGFLFRTEAAAVEPAVARIGVEGHVFELTAAVARSAVSVAVPLEMLELLRTGTRMRLEVGGADQPMLTAIFNLRNSAKVIEAIAPRCSPIDMSAYEAVTLLENGPAVDVARALLGEEIALFRGATGKQPVIAAVQIDLADARRLLFGSLCGSTSYYGASGCTLAGWASSGAPSVWQQVYSTDGVRLHLDRAAMREGWPGLATVPAVRGTEATHWVWNGSAYEASDAQIVAGQSGAGEPTGAVE